MSPPEKIKNKMSTRRTLSHETKKKNQMNQIKYFYEFNKSES